MVACDSSKGMLSRAGPIQYVGIIIAKRSDIAFPSMGDIIFIPAFEI